MNVLLIGSGKGVWEIRGQQLGAAMGARVCEVPSAADLAWADVVVLVKRAPVAFAQQARKGGKPVVWDPVDAWSQPAQNTLDAAAARTWLQAEIAKRGAVLTLGATQAMADAAGPTGVYLSHHHLVGLTAAPVRDEVQTVVYDGRPDYLGRWAGILTRLCADRGWRFLVNPPDLRVGDIFVSLRDGIWDGYMPREWKSGVKVLNAMAVGRPIIAQAMASVREIGPPGHSVVDGTEASLADALDLWSDRERRSAVAVQCAAMAPRYTVTAIAQRYRTILEAVACPA